MTARPEWAADPASPDPRRRIPRVHAPAADWAGGRIELPPDEAHHLTRVLRLGEGDAVEVFDGAGRSAEGRLTAIGKRRATVEIAGAPCVEPAPAVELILVQSLPKGHKADLIVQKGVELGLARLLFVETARSVARLGPEGDDDRAARWRAVAVSAAKQCGRNRLPAIEACDRVESALGRVPADAARMACLPAAGAPPLRDALRAAAEQGARSVAAFVGPEGGFDPAEAGLLLRSGARAVSLGRHVLRTETAALFVMSALAYEFP